MEALVAIHMVHRLVAYVLLIAIGVVAWMLNRETDPALRRAGRWMALLALAQLLSGLSNVVLGWPLVAALAHSAGAAALVAVTTSLLARALRRAPAAERSHS